MKKLVLLLLLLALPGTALALPDLPATASVTASRLMVRAKPEAKATTLGSLTKGAQVTVQAVKAAGQEHVWCRIRYKGHDAWVYGEFLSGQWQSAGADASAAAAPAGVPPSIQQLAAQVEKAFGSTEADAVRIFGPALRQRSEKSPQGRKETLFFSGHTAVFNGSALIGLSLIQPEGGKPQSFGPLTLGAPSSQLAPYGEHAVSDGQHILCTPDAVCFHITVQNAKIAALSYSRP